MEGALSRYIKPRVPCGRRYSIKSKVKLGTYNAYMYLHVVVRTYILY